MHTPLNNRVTALCVCVSVSWGGVSNSRTMWVVLKHWCPFLFIFSCGATIDCGLKGGIDFTPVSCLIHFLKPQPTPPQYYFIFSLSLSLVIYLSISVEIPVAYFCSLIYWLPCINIFHNSASTACLTPFNPQFTTVFIYIFCATMYLFEFIRIMINFELL